MEETIEKIFKIVNWYSSINNDFTNVNLLMNSSVKLVGNYFYLSTVLSEVEDNVRTTKRVYELRMNEVKKKYHHNGNLASRYAIAATIKERKEYDEAEVLKERITQIHKATKAVIDRMNQHISRLTKEEPYNRKQV